MKTVDPRKAFLERRKYEGTSFPDALRELHGKGKSPAPAAQRKPFADGGGAGAQQAGLFDTNAEAAGKKTKDEPIEGLPPVLARRLKELQSMGDGLSRPELAEKKQLMDAAIQFQLNRGTSANEVTKQAELDKLQAFKDKTASAVAERARILTRDKQF